MSMRYQKPTIQVIVDDEQKQVMADFAKANDVSISQAALFLIEKGLADRSVIMPPAKPNKASVSQATIPLRFSQYEAEEYLVMRWSINPTVASEVIEFFSRNPPPTKRASEIESKNVFEVPHNAMADLEMLKPILNMQVGPPTDKTLVAGPWQSKAPASDDDFKVIEE